MAVDTFRENGGDFGHGVFNGKYHQQFLQLDVPFAFEKRNTGSGHMTVVRSEVLPTLGLLGQFDHSVLYLGRSGQADDAFVTEYDIQRALLLNWSKTIFAERYEIIIDEFPLDGGLNSRRIDILARDAASSDWLVVEVKRAEAKIDAVRQIRDYLLTLGKRDDFAGGKIFGVLVAERVPEVVRSMAALSGITAYEISFPLSMVRVA